MHPEKARRLFEKAHEIHGWFSPEAGMLFAWIDEIQKRNGIRGDIFEIGCHHGRSTVLLGGMVDRPDEKLGVCDLFGAQEENVSDSGRGDHRQFMRNLDPLLRDGLEMEVFRENSRSLTPDRIGTGHRFFHIDGGHDAAEALSDLELAARSTVEGGVIALDDPFRAEWPGVTEALVRFLDAREGLHAVLVGFNKIFLVSPSHLDLYRDAFRDKAEREAFGLGHPCHLKELPFLGRELLILYVPSYLQGSEVGAQTWPGRALGALRRIVSAGYDRVTVGGRAGEGSSARPGRSP